MVSFTNSCIALHFASAVRPNSSDIIHLRLKSALCTSLLQGCIFGISAFNCFHSSNRGIISKVSRASISMCNWERCFFGKSFSTSLFKRRIMTVFFANQCTSWGFDDPESSQYPKGDILRSQYLSAYSLNLGKNSLRTMLAWENNSDGRFKAGVPVNNRALSILRIKGDRPLVRLVLWFFM